MRAGQAWAVEVKFDGMRVQLRRDGHAVCLRSRPVRDCPEEFPELAAIARVSVARGRLDVCVGRSSIAGRSSIPLCGPQAADEADREPETEDHHA
jgi:hypothetical protein